MPSRKEAQAPKTDSLGVAMYSKNLALALRNMEAEHAQDQGDQSNCRDLLHIAKRRIKTSSYCTAGHRYRSAQPIVT